MRENLWVTVEGGHGVRALVGCEWETQCFIKGFSAGLRGNLCEHLWDVNGKRSARTLVLSEC